MGTQLLTETTTDTWFDAKPDFADDAGESARFTTARPQGTLIASELTKDEADLVARVHRTAVYDAPFGGGTTNVPSWAEERVDALRFLLPKAVAAVEAEVELDVDLTPDPEIEVWGGWTTPTVGVTDNDVPIFGATEWVEPNEAATRARLAWDDAEFALLREPIVGLRDAARAAHGYGAESSDASESVLEREFAMDENRDRVYVSKATRAVLPKGTRIPDGNPKRTRLIAMIRAQGADPKAPEVVAWVEANGYDRCIAQLTAREMAAPKAA